MNTPPTPEEVKKISQLSDPILRNLHITQCYWELSASFAERTGLSANWCTFAMWASKQAGQTIRKEDLHRTLEAMLKIEPEIEQSLSLIFSLARRLGAGQSFEQIRKSTLGVVIAETVNRSSNATGRGNKKVFEEIGYEFARFIADCLNDAAYTQSHITEFCQQLRPGDPPNGQGYLRRAFTRYYLSLFEDDAKKRCELQLLANIEIGLHEQTRLQPEILESLNAALIDKEEIKNRIINVLFPKGNFIVQLRMFFQRLFGKTSLLDKAVESLVLLVQEHLRRALTVHLMTLTLPPDNRLRLGQDLVAEFPAQLKELANPDLLALLTQIDTTRDSLRESGATDWADLAERLHYIADLFRCYHEAKELFATTFTAEQVKQLKEGRLPEGKL